MMKYRCKKCGKVVECSPFDPSINTRLCPQCQQAAEILKRTGGKNRATRRLEAKQRQKMETKFREMVRTGKIAMKTPPSVTAPIEQVEPIVVPATTEPLELPVTEPAAESSI